MAERRITCRRGEGICIGDAATVRVDRRVTLIVNAPRETRVERLASNRPAGERCPPCAPGQ